MQNFRCNAENVQVTLATVIREKLRKHKLKHRAHLGLFKYVIKGLHRFFKLKNKFSLGAFGMLFDRKP